MVKILNTFYCWYSYKSVSNGEKHWKQILSSRNMPLSVMEEDVGGSGGFRSEERMLWSLCGLHAGASRFPLLKDVSAAVTSEENSARREQHERKSASSCDFLHFHSAGLHFLRFMDRTSVSQGAR